MQHLPTIFLIIIFLQGYTLSAEATQPYCYKNITEVTEKVVNKTRLKTVTKKGFFNKLAQKKETQVEVYEDYEPAYKIKLERVCCEGYKLSDLDMCEPQCVENGCPAHSKCVEPEVCECVKGYFSVRSPIDNKHYCEPICEKPCPKHGVCVAPNECACMKGFRVTDQHLCEPHCDTDCRYGGKCVAPNKCQCPEGFKTHLGFCLPICSSADHCDHCVGDICVCLSGFEWNKQTLKCEISSTAIKQQDYEFSTYSTDTTETQEIFAADMDLETDIDTDKDDIDPSQVFEEISDATTEHDEGFSTPKTVFQQNKCADDFVYYKGKCRALKFASNEIDCRFKPCEDKHSYCLENGTCACNEGYQWFKIHVIDNDSLNITIKAMCLTAAEYKARSQQHLEDIEKENEPALNWVNVLFMALGVVVLVTTLAYLGLKLLRTQTGQLDVNGKNLACSYKSRTCAESEKSVI